MNPNQLPGVGTEREAGFRRLMLSGQPIYLPGGIVIDGAESRDVLNTGDTDVLRCGALLGKITATKKWAPSILGVLAAAFADAYDDLTVSAATAAEIVRRVGSTGTLKIVGPPTAGGTVAVTSIDYTAVNTTTGVITCDLAVAKIAGSLVMAADGSETIRGIMGIESGLKVTDDDNDDIDVSCNKLIIGSGDGVVDFEQIVNAPSDTALVAWIKAALRAVGAGYVFDDDFIG